LTAARLPVPQTLGRSQENAGYSFFIVLTLMVKYLSLIFL
jgi:hypothetical protein